MTTVATIVQDIPQGTTRRIRGRFTHSTGVSVDRYPMTLQSGDDAQAILDSMTDRYDEMFVNDELDDALEQFFLGVDMDDLHDSGHFKIITKSKMRRKCVRRAANRMAQANDAGIEELSLCSTWVNTLTNPTLATLLTNPNATWSNSEAGAFKSDLANLQTSQAGLDHEKGEQDEDA